MQSLGQRRSSRGGQAAKRAPVERGGCGGGRGSRGGRGGLGSRGSRGGARVDRVLQEALNAQDNEEREKSNAFVLGVVGGIKDYLEDEEYGDDEMEDEMDDDGDDGDDRDDEVYTQSQASVQSEPAVTSKASKCAGKINASASKAGSKQPPRVGSRTTTKHLKNPVQACDIMLKNLELFQKALEIKQNNQFRLVNENLGTFQATASSLFEKLQKTQNTLLKTLNGLVNEVGSVAKFRSNNTSLAIKKFNSEMKMSSTEDPIVLDDDDEVSFESQKSILDSLNKPIKVEKRELVEQKVEQKLEQKVEKRDIAEVKVERSVTAGGVVQGNGSLGRMGHTGQIGASQGNFGFGGMGQMSGSQGSHFNGIGYTGLIGGSQGNFGFGGMGQMGQLVGGQMNGGGFGGPNLMAGLGCYSLDVNNNSMSPTIDLLKLIKKCEPITKPTLVAGAAFDFIFDFEISNNVFKDGNFNVYGVAPNGDKDVYYGLDKIKLDALEKFVRDKMQQGVDKNALWKNCVKAINRKLCKLNAKNKNINVPEDLNDESID